MPGGYARRFKSPNPRLNKQKTSIWIFLTFTVLVPVQNISFRVSSAEEFWYKDVLELNVTFLPNGTQVNLEENSWYNWGKPNYKIAGCLALCWTLVAGFLIKGQLMSEHISLNWKKMKYFSINRWCHWFKSGKNLHSTIQRAATFKRPWKKL